MGTLFAGILQACRETLQIGTQTHLLKVQVHQVQSLLSILVLDITATRGRSAQKRTFLVRAPAYLRGLIDWYQLPVYATAMGCSRSPSRMIGAADMRRKDQGHRPWTRHDKGKTRLSLPERKNTKVCGPESGVTRSHMKAIRVLTMNILPRLLNLQTRHLTGDNGLHRPTRVLQIDQPPVAGISVWRVLI